MDLIANKNLWVEVDRKRKVRAGRRSEIFGHVRSGVRSIFIFLFIATILVFGFSHYTEIQGNASARLVHVVKKAPDMEVLRQNAVNYEKQVDGIAR